LSDLLLITGALLLLWVVLVSVRPVLASRELHDETYLVSSVDFHLPLPAMPPIPNPETGTFDLYVPLTYKQDPPAPVPSAGPVVRVVIPSINIDRAVVRVEQYMDGNGQMQWDADSLFANNNRLDLVGQLATSVNPGDGSNIVLIGHNYNLGWNAWGAVFLHLKKLQPGDQILLYAENGGEFSYTVQEVVEVPWVYMDSTELDRHRSLLWPTPDERVTLVTCGGANIGIWSARVYVVAK
jgi:LPXTG-site transpeptidase (sortase) family protein